MKKFAVAYMNYFDNDLIIDFIEAPSKLKALSTFLAVNARDFIPVAGDENEAIESIKQYMFDCDANIEIEELPE